MQAYKNDFLDHIRWLRHATSAAGAECIIAGDSLQVLLRQGSRHWALLPQFLTNANGSSLYTAELHDETEMFAGWLPYRGKRWPISSDKLAFKRYAAASGLPVPPHFTEAADSLGDVIVKRPASSFGQGLLGPFRSARERPLDHSQGEYYERFLRGDLLKIWFWNEGPVCAEHDQMSHVTGDGRSTIRDLVEQRLQFRNRPLSAAARAELLESCATLLRYLGADFHTAPPKGSQQLVDFRYASALRHPAFRAILDLANDPEPGWLPQVRRAGAVFLKAVPEEMRRNTLFTIDAILDGAGQVWFLEMNSNPVVHPLAYPLIVEDLLASEPPRFDLAQSPQHASPLS